MRAPTIAEQTGWLRPYPAMLLQGFDGAGDFLLRVSRFEYELEDPAFAFYCERRGVLWLAGKEGSEFWRWCVVTGRRGELPGHAGLSLRLACARLQDAAELFAAGDEVTARIMAAWVPPEGMRRWRPAPAGDEAPIAAPRLTGADCEDRSGQLDLFAEA